VRRIFLVVTKGSAEAPPRLLTLEFESGECWGEVEEDEEGEGSKEKL
jgi:hypothetical protein